MCIACVEITKSRLGGPRNADAKERAVQLKKELAWAETALETETDPDAKQHVTEVRDRLKNQQYELSRKL